MRYLRYAIPLVVLIGLIGLFAVGLQHDPREIPSPLIGKAAPAFDLPVDGQPGKTMTTADLHGPVVVNFFASWCEGCQIEHPYLLQLAQQDGAQLVGIDYKDAADDLHTWLERRGNPYSLILSDLSGQTGINWGVYGVPETFVLDSHGTIVYKQIGPMTPEVWAQHVEPVLKAGA